MIAKVTSGSGFRGLLNYLMSEKKQPRESEKSREKELERTDEPTLERKPSERASTARGQEKATLKTAARERNERESREENRRQKEAQKRAEKNGTEHELLAGEKVSLGERGGRHRVIGGNMSGQNPRELAREFGVFREQRSDIEKPVHHVSLSAGESDKLSIKQWNRIAANTLSNTRLCNSGEPR